ncbi:aminotransferase class V-fold PLP-dependent enzyme [Marispirochaeta aestuarii]|uniref:aminotransferase class V-fold PLP-dependent enzyme n=1 Tax=Marispirochaeta aestuarii TaxID=1963862 RepID=UPI0029C6BB83|nr:aminotransferase class V-fold PLP-dependent enzyme [Marispirochaeta aestuarii]
MIYLDNAATSFPKPAGTAQAVYDFLTRTGANPGRSAHGLSLEAARIVYEAREALNHFFSGPDPLRVIFTHNATYGLNMALKGILKPGSRVITTGMEHNAVMRPLRSLEKEGIELAVVPCGRDGTLDPADLKKALRQKADVVVMSAASNVTGTIMPVGEVGTIVREKGSVFLVDSAQAGGVLPLDMEKDKIDLLAFTGHKSLYGPPGTGGLIFGSRIRETEVSPLIEGGTGSRSETEEQPQFLPDRFESGTCNAAGIAGLRAGLQWLLERGREVILKEEQRQSARLAEGLSGIPGLVLYGPADASMRTGVLSFTLEGHEVSELGEVLDTDYGILIRVGLHCAPLAHRTIGTFPSGTVRMSVGAFTGDEDIDAAVRAVESLAAGTSK